MWNKVRDHENYINILVLINEQRQTEAKIGGFANIYLIMITGRMFIEGKKFSEIIHPSL